MLKNIVVLFLLALVLQAFSCDMFAMIVDEGGSFTDNIAEVEEMFDFFKSRSSASLNNDGYGIIAYYGANQYDSWYKTGSGTWYGDGGVDPLDEAEIAITYGQEEYYLVIAHARNATGGEGSHPFTLDDGANVYSMCHNGVIKYSLREAFMHYLGEDWFLEYPSNWSGEFGDTGSFIDSELYFHYLMNSVLDDGSNVFEEIKNALDETDILGQNPSEELLTGHSRANILFSDGEALYAFRNSNPQISSYSLSWKRSGNLVVVKTQTELENELMQNELIRFSRNGDVLSETLEFFQEDPFVPVAQFYAYPNPAKENVYIYFEKPRDIDQNSSTFDNEELNIYNVKGQLVRQLVPVTQSSNMCRYIWNRRDDNNYLVSAGVYLIEHLNSQKVAKVVLSK